MSLNISEPSFGLRSSFLLALLLSDASLFEVASVCGSRLVLALHGSGRVLASACSTAHVLMPCRSVNLWSSVLV